MDDLKRFRVPVLILSGGEPLLRPDIFDIAQRAKGLGFYVGLSSNGTLIDESNIAVSRRLTLTMWASASTASAIRTTSSAAWRAPSRSRCRHAPLPRPGPEGRRALHHDAGQRPRPAGLLQLVEDEGIDRFYFSHLNYAGRGNKNRKDDAHHQMTREAMDLLFDTAGTIEQRGLNKEFTTGNNDADGVYFLHWVREALPRPRGAHARQARAVGRQFLRRERRQHRQPRQRAPRHHVVAPHPRQRARAALLGDLDGHLRPAHGRPQGRRAGRGRCGACRHFDICDGNTRVRAQQLTGDPWAEDPGCYLTDEEIGIS
jgi:MoaA/NifB/PqqE/SkfB family radical SAM enzyme